MKVKYVGPFDAVEVPGLGVVARGESVACRAALAKSLLEQDENWQPAEPVTATPVTTEKEI